MCGGVALYLAAHAGFRLRMTGKLEGAKVIAAVAALIVYLVTADADAWLTALCLTAVLTALTIREANEVTSPA
jgi:hypothetical protein